MKPFDLSNQNIRITTRFDADYEYDVKVTSEKSGDFQKLYQLSGGYSVEIFNCLQYMLNFTYTINSNVGIYDLANASANDVDLYLASLSVYTTRANFADPTFVTGRSRAIAFVNQDFEYLTRDVFVSVLSFKYLMQVSGIISMLLIPLIIFAKYEGVSVLESTFHGLALILHQDGFVRFSRVTSRIMLLVMSSSLLIMSAGYSGHLTSILAIKDQAFTSIDELIQSKYDVLMEVGRSNSTISLMLERMGNLEQVSKLLTRVSKSHKKRTPKCILDYIKEVQTTPTAYIIDEESGLAAINEVLDRIPCSWKMMTVFGVQYQWCMFLKKHSTYKAAINYGILRLRERGVLSKIKNMWLPKMSECEREHTHPFKSIHMPQLQSAFTCLGIGFIISCIVLCMERCLKPNSNANSLQFLL